MDQIFAANVQRYDSKVVDSYLLEPVHADRIRQVADLVMSLSSGSALSVAEFGAGGHPLIEQMPRAWQDVNQYVVVDGMPTHNCSAVIANLSCDLPLASNAFDLIVAMDIIEHIFDTRRFLTECYRVLKPHGRLIVTTPNLATLQDRLRFLLGRAPRQCSPLHEYLHLHIRPFTLSSLKESLSLSGYEVEAVRTSGLVWRWHGTHRITRRPGVMTGLGTNLIVQARKRGV